MRLRNSTTGTVISVGDESTQRYQNAGWTNTDETSSTSQRSTSERDEDEEQKPRRRRTAR